MPDDIALAVFDDPSSYAVMTPSITAVSIELERQASEATRLLKERLAGTYTGTPRLVTIPQLLVVRESTVGPHLVAQPRDSDGRTVARRARGPQHHPTTWPQTGAEPFVLSDELTETAVG